TNATSSARDDGGGFVGVGVPTADANQNDPNHKTQAYVDGRIVATGAVKVLALTLNQAQASANTITGGLVGVAVGHTNSTIAVDTTAKVDDNTAILAGGAVIVAAEMKTNQNTNTDATGIGLGGDANADAHSTLSGTTEVDVGTAAKVEGRIVVLSVTDGDSKATGDSNDHPLMTVTATSEGDGGGLVAVGTASSTVNVNIPFKIQVNGAAAITGWEGVDFRTSYNAINTDAHGESSATGLFGGVHSSSDNTTTLDSTVKGLAGAV